MSSEAGSSAHRNYALDTGTELTRLLLLPVPTRTDTSLPLCSFVYEADCNEDLRNLCVDFGDVLRAGTMTVVDLTDPLMAPQAQLMQWRSSRSSRRP